MTAKAALLALLLAAPAAAQTPDAQAPASRSDAGVVQPPEADNSVFDDLAESFDQLFGGTTDRNLRQMMVFRIRQGRCDDARKLAQEEGRPELAAMVPKACPPHR